MPVFPQPGGCLCGEVRYELGDDPLTLYACHCSDCQTQTASVCSLAAIVRRDSLRLVQGTPREYSIQLKDGRPKTSTFCARCSTRLWAPSRQAELALLEAGTLDDTSWVWPVGHIWTRSAQPWVIIPDDTLRYERQPTQQDFAGLVRVWKERRSKA